MSKAFPACLKYRGQTIDRDPHPLLAVSHLYKVEEYDGYSMYAADVLETRPGDVNIEGTVKVDVYPGGRVKSPRFTQKTHA